MSDKNRNNLREIGGIAIMFTVSSTFVLTQSFFWVS